MSSRASESVSVGTFWNSPSLRSLVASSSPVGFSREREVGAVEAITWRRGRRGFCGMGSGGEMRDGDCCGKRCGGEGSRVIRGQWKKWRY